MKAAAFVLALFLPGWPFGWHGPTPDDEDEQKEAGATGAVAASSLETVDESEPA